VGREGPPACKEVYHSLGMCWEGQAVAVSLSGPPTYIYNLFRIFDVFSLYLINATLSIESSNHREQDMQKSEVKSSKTERERELIVGNNELEGLPMVAMALTLLTVIGRSC
jgi:hypothetical protein